MTQEALKLALEALKTELSIDWTNNYEFNASAEKMREAIAAIKEALAQPSSPAQNTAAYIKGFEDGQRTAKVGFTQLLASQPSQRTWVGLTDVEIDYLLVSTTGENEETHISFAKAIENKLKQMNGFAEEKKT